MEVAPWRKAEYQRIESVDYFMEDVDKYYRHSKQGNPKELETKVGLVLSLSAFFAGMEGGKEENFRGEKGTFTIKK